MNWHWRNPFLGKFSSILWSVRCLKTPCTTRITVCSDPMGFLVYKSFFFLRIVQFLDVRLGQLVLRPAVWFSSLRNCTRLDKNFAHEIGHCSYPVYYQNCSHSIQMWKDRSSWRLQQYAISQTRVCIKSK